MALNVTDFFAHKNILITGTTGFLGKVLLEKILRTLERVGKIYVLIRADNLESAKTRFNNEVLKVELFRPLKEKHGADFDNFISRKVVVLQGDIGVNINLGIQYDSLLDQLYQDIHIIFNVAATTSLDDRYDISLNVNTKGAMHIVEFAKTCKSIEILVHVSTGRYCGIAMETSLHEGIEVCNSQSSNFKSPLIHDIEGEFLLLKNSLDKLKSEESQDKKIEYLKAMGMERAKLFGWANTYSFTKAMGEMLVNKLRGDLPVVILRPTMIESTFIQPFSGWIEGTRTVDVLIVGYGMGRVRGFLGHPNMTIDVVPVDMVVNAMIVSVVENAKRAGEIKVYHMASSIINPLNMRALSDIGITYFRNNPYIDKKGAIVTPKGFAFFHSMRSFHLFMFLHYGAFIKIIRVFNKLLCKAFDSKVIIMTRRYNFAMCLAELYEPYAFFHGRFDVKNLEGLMDMLNDEEKKVYPMELQKINWFDYYYNVHIPGLVRNILK